MPGSITCKFAPIRSHFEKNVWRSVCSLDLKFDNGSTANEREIRSKFTVLVSKRNENRPLPSFPCTWPGGGSLLAPMVIFQGLWA